jgi:ABC-type antimicrobial peptide transport system ATPase subunit
VLPKLIVCYEPMSAFDLSIQAQVINLLEDPQQQFGRTYIFIARDLSAGRIMLRIRCGEGPWRAPFAPATEEAIHGIDHHRQALLRPSEFR